MTLLYRCSNCGAELATTNADPLYAEIARLRMALHDIVLMDERRMTGRQKIAQAVEVAMRALTSH